MDGVCVKRRDSPRRRPVGRELPGPRTRLLLLSHRGRAWPDRTEIKVLADLIVEWGSLSRLTVFPMTRMLFARVLLNGPVYLSTARSGQKEQANVVAGHCEASKTSTL